MEFHTYSDMIHGWNQRQKALRNVEEIRHVRRDEFRGFYEEMLDEMDRKGSNTRGIVVSRMVMERDWYEAGRPYYNVWPVMLPMIDKLKLDMLGKDIPFTPYPLCLRFPKSRHNAIAINDTEYVRSLTFGCTYLEDPSGQFPTEEWLVISFDVGDVNDEFGIPLTCLKLMPVFRDKTVEECNLYENERCSVFDTERIGPSVIEQLIKLCLTVCLIGEDPDLVTRDVLAKDAPKYDKASEEKKLAMINRAKQRGKNGFHLGARMELLPHYRRPHLAVVWTGKGRVTPKVVLRKGSVVKRQRLTDIPTGFVRDEV